jgi:translation elongation factor EF-G
VRDDKHIRASVPESLEGEVMQQLVRLGGTITNIESEAELRTAISSTLPKTRVADFRSWLQSFTDGRGLVSED